MFHNWSTNQSPLRNNRVWGEFWVLYKYTKFGLKNEKNTLQPTINILVPEDHQAFYFFIHNKGQMYIPKRDEAFGSFYFYVTMPMSANATPMQYLGEQSYRIERTHYKTLRTENQRCDDRVDATNTFTCITKYLEQTVGCSIGMYGTDSTILRSSAQLPHIWTYFNIRGIEK